MSGRSRLAALGLVALAILVGGGLVAFAASACPIDLPGQPCPNAATNQAVVIGLAAVALGILASAFAFLGEAALRRGISYRGAWWRAARRGLLIGGAVAAIGSLRLAGALSPAGGIFIVVLAAALEWFAMRWLDRT